MVLLETRGVEVFEAGPKEMVHNVCKGLSLENEAFTGGMGKVLLETGPCASLAMMVGSPARLGHHAAMLKQS